MSNNLLKTTRQAAENLLARREHSRLELRKKLQLRSLDSASIDAVLKQLETENLLSDERFCECYVRMRMNRGYGPLRIQAELVERGVNESLIAEYLDNDKVFWHQQVQQVRLKKFGEEIPRDNKEKARQIRFLQHRGFTFEQINQCLK